LDILNYKENLESFDGLPVDAGLIGIISLDYFLDNDIEVPSSNFIINIPNDFTPENEEGVFNFDCLCIDTLED